MTQAVTDTLNNSLYTVLQQQEKTDCVDSSCMSTKESFDFIIEKNQEKFDKISSTIGDLKTSKQSLNKLSADFKAYLNNEIKSANDESSLDLTLSQDIKDFITQLQNEKSTDSDLVVDNTDSEITDCMLNEISENDRQTDVLLQDISLISPAVECSLDINIADKLSKLESIALGNVNLISSENNVVQTDTIMDNTDSINNLTNKLSETFSKLFTNNDTKSVQEPTIQESEINDEMLKELNVESVEAQAESSSQDGYDMHQQTTEEHVIKAMISTDVNADFESDLAETNKTIDTNPIEQKEVHSEKIIEQVAKQLNGIKANSKVNIVLNPENLGKVSIHVAKSAEGMSAQFTVSTNEAKEILLKNLDGLKETLLSHGINADNVSVKMNETQKSEYKQDWTEQENSGNKNKEQQHHQQKEEKDKNIFEKMMAFINQEEMESI